MQRNIKHFASPSFWKCYKRLPKDIRNLAKKNFDLLKEDPTHPSLHTKKVGNYWAVRVGRKYRVLGLEIKNGVLWFWIGTHSEYDKMLS